MESLELVSLPQIDDFLFLVADSSKQFLGTAFLLQGNKAVYLITATHVVADALGITRENLLAPTRAKINVFFPKNGKWFQAKSSKYLSPYLHNDVIALHLTHAPPESVPAILGSSVNTSNHNFVSAGIRDAGTRAHGSIIGHELYSRHRHKEKRLELYSTSIDGGMSGGPIIDVSSKLVVGMIVSAWYSKTGKDEGTAYGVTSETIANVFKETTVSSHSLNFRLNQFAKKIIQTYRTPAAANFQFLGVNTDLFVDMGLWQFGVPYADESKVQFMWLSDQEKEKERRKGIISDSSINHLMQWSKKANAPCFLLLAEFGMGKSTILRRLEFLLAEVFLSEGIKIPIRMPLSFRPSEKIKDHSIFERLSDFIVEEYHQKFTREEVKDIINSGQAILLLDSFDEMVVSPAPGTQQFVLNEIMQEFAAVPDLKIVIASRDNYFYGSHNFHESLIASDPFFPCPQFELGYLRGFRLGEITEYLEARLKESATVFWTEIQKIHDLPDLARRPILLLMMTILEPEVLSGKIRTRQELYREFVRVWLKRERLNGRIRLPEEVILYVLKLLSELATFHKGRTFPQDEIDRLLISEFGYTRSEAESLGSDFKVCCFLGRSLNDEYKFLHESFREYFLSLVIIDKIKKYDTAILRSIFINPEVCKFVISELDDKIQFFKDIVATEVGNDYLLTNAMMLFEMIIDDEDEVNLFYSNLPTNRCDNVSITNTLPPQFVIIPSGTFLMGSWHGRPDEIPLHMVEVKEFAICKFPVTNMEFYEFTQVTSFITEAERLGEGRIWTGNTWQLIKGLTWRNPRPGNIDIQSRLDHPVTQITWHDAVAFCRWRSDTSGLTVELPSEAEWEYACRAGSLGKWCFGNDFELLPEYAWYNDNLDSTTFSQPVGLKAPNRWGLYDMHGNVREWCNDVYDKYPGNTLNWDLGDRYSSVSKEEYHVLRGGHFGSSSDFLRSAIRVSGKNGLSTDYTGFRLKIRLPL